MTSPLGAARAVTKLPAQNLDRARRFYRDRLGLERVEERELGLRYVCGTTEFHIFASLGCGVRPLHPAGLRGRGHRPGRGPAPAGTRPRVRDLRPGDLEVTDQIVVVPNNYPSKGTGERGAFFFDSEGNLLALGQATR